jgi:hypothetical protein
MELALNRVTVTVGLLYTGPAGMAIWHLAVVIELMSLNASNGATTGADTEAKDNEDESPLH